MTRFWREISGTVSADDVREHSCLCDAWIRIKTLEPETYSCDRPIHEFWTNHGRRTGDYEIIWNDEGQWSMRVRVY